MTRIVEILVLVVAASGCTTAHTPNDDDHAVVYEIGGAGEVVA